MYNAAFQKPFDFIRMFTGITANSGDLWHYYDAMRNWFNSEMIFNDSRTMIRLNTLLRFISFGTYFPHAVILCFLAMMGLTGIFKIFNKVLPGKEFLIILIVYLMPSTLLWTSGMIKEAYLVFSIGMLLYCINNYLSDNKLNFRRISAISFFGFSLLCIKSYVLFAVLPGIISWIICEKYNSRKTVTAIAVHVIYLILLFNLADVFTSRSVPSMLKLKQEEFYRVAYNEQAKSNIYLNRLDDTNTTLLLTVPEAFFITLLRPYLGESKNPLILIAAAENLLILIFVLCCIVGYFKNMPFNLPSLFYPALYFSIIMFVLIGLVTPILGAIVRYKVPALPFLLFAFLCLTKTKRTSWNPLSGNKLFFK